MMNHSFRNDLIFFWKFPTIHSVNGDIIPKHFGRLSCLGYKAIFFFPWFSKLTDLIHCVVSNLVIMWNLKVLCYVSVTIVQWCFWPMKESRKTIVNDATWLKIKSCNFIFQVLVNIGFLFFVCVAFIVQFLCA